ncbi:MAG: glycosyltransferase family 4 protein [Spirochaetales bacterium]|nr:glycosyltransferase family 4 protein [Spirochaetales bacterium]
MKIAMIINSSSGLYNFRKDLIQRMIADGHEVIALTPLEGRTDQLEEIGVRLINTEIDRRGLNPLHDISLYRQYRKILKKEKPDFAVTYTIKPNVYGGVACRMSRISYAGNITGLGTAFESSGLLRKVATIMNKVALKKAKCVFFENAENRDLFVNEGIISKNQAVLLNGAGVNLEHFSYQSYPTDDNGIRFLFMGRVMKEKGIDELFSAMQRLRDDGENCSLDLLGSFEEKYEEQIKQYEKDGWLRFHGYQSDVRPYIADSHCFVLPSYHEGMANTNLESAATGRPVITTNIPGCKEAVVDGKSGFLCAVRNANDLCKKMKQFIALSQDKREQMGKAGRNHMENVFDKRKVVAETVKHIY